MMRRLLLCCLALPLLLSGCGFHLAGNYLLPDSVKVMYVSAPDPYSSLARRIKDALQDSGVEVIKIPDPRYPTLTIQSDKLERRTLSLYPDGQVAEYRLNYTVVTQVTRKNQSPHTFKVQVSRDYLDDPRLALAKSREMEELVDEMRDDAAQQVLRQLATLK